MLYRGSRDLVAPIISSHARCLWFCGMNGIKWVTLWLDGCRRTLKQLLRSTGKLTFKLWTRTSRITVLNWAVLLSLRKWPRLHYLSSRRWTYIRHIANLLRKSLISTHPTMFTWQSTNHFGNCTDLWPTTITFLLFSNQLKDTPVKVLDLRIYGSGFICRVQISTACCRKISERKFWRCIPPSEGPLMQVRGQMI